MKRLNLVLGAALVAAGLTSCKNEAEMAAEKSVDRYESFVDSIDGLDDEETMANWDAIEMQYQARLTDAEAALDNVKDKENAQERINDKKEKYEEVKMEASAGMQASAGNALRASYFGDAAFASDNDFSWVNKDNIVSVYQKFVDTFNANKDSYTRADFDRIKAWYEALDERKNTVENEGLSTKDNLKIAALKVEFAPKFKFEKAFAKGEANEDAKDKAEDDDDVNEVDD